MASQNVFKRYELKYLIMKEQKSKILEVMNSHMKLDEYGRTTIRNIYFDTDDYRIIRRSIEKPIYKEKLRIRSYDKANPDSIVFVELKKKYNHLVYKRRIPLTSHEAIQWVCDNYHSHMDTQISEEIVYFLEFYQKLKPSVFLSYEREAYFSEEQHDFRVTFDENILCRQKDISLQSEIYGTTILDKDMVLMEIKCAGGIPLWMTEVLSKEHIYRTSFSKYGTAYQKLIYPKLKEATCYA